MKSTNRKIQQVKQLALVCILTLGLFSCDNDDSSTDNDNDKEETASLIGIKSTNLPSGNSCNIWDLIKSPAVIFPTFSTLDTATVVDDVDVDYLGQTTMNNQSSAYDKMNKKYAVSTGERVIIYDADLNSIDSIFEDDEGTYFGIQAMEFVDGVLYIIKDNEISSMSLDGIISPIMSITSIGISSNMAFNENKIYFIQKGILYTFNTTLETLTEVSFSSEDITYNGVEYHLGAIYATKRHYSVIADDFVKIDAITGAEEVLFSLEDSYIKDYSRVSSALDYNTSIYYLVSSNGHDSDQHTVTTVNVSDAIPTPSSDTMADNNYAFGLQLQD